MPERSIVTAKNVTLVNQGYPFKSFKKYLTS